MKFHNPSTVQPTWIPNLDLAGSGELQYPFIERDISMSIIVDLPKKLKNRAEQVPFPLANYQVQNMNLKFEP